MNSQFGNKIRILREEQKMLLRQLAPLLDMDTAQLSKIERGERLATNEQLKRLAAFYKVSEASLKVKHTAEKILKEYGVNETTYDAIQLVNEQIEPYITKSKGKKS